MENLEGMGFDAVGIEHSFAQFLGKQIGARGGPHDADVFRAGNIASLGKLIEAVADHFERRVGRITFLPAPTEGGGSKAQIDYAIGSLRGIAKEMKQSKDVERDDYHWLIVGSLILSIHALLEHAGA